MPSPEMMKVCIAALAVFFLAIVAISSLTKSPGIAPRQWVAKHSWVVRAGTYSFGIVRCVPEMAVQTQFTPDEQARLRRSLCIRFGHGSTYVQPRSLPALYSIFILGSLAFALSAIYLTRRTRLTEKL